MPSILIKCIWCSVHFVMFEVLYVEDCHFFPHKYKLTTLIFNIFLLATLKRVETHSTFCTRAIGSLILFIERHDMTFCWLIQSR